MKKFLFFLNATLLGGTCMFVSCKITNMMRRKYSWMLGILLIMAANHVSGQTDELSRLAQSKMAPMVQAFAVQQQTTAARRSSTQKASKPALFMVRTTPDADPTEVRRQIATTGATVKSVIGSMMMVAAEAHQLQDIAGLEGVLLIEKPARPRMKLDISRQASHTDEVQSGNSELLPQAYQGEGVIIGIIDVGFDLTHPAFKDEQGNLRVKAAYYPGMTNGKGNKAVVDGEVLEGTLFDTPELMLDTTRLKDTESYHGTHVVSCAAASPINSVKGITGGSLCGMAPKAELILCNTTPDEAQEDKYEDSDDDAETLNTMNFLNYISDYAKRAGKPFMVTMSMNSHDGTHDGTSANAQLFKEFCNKGNVMTIATGNEGGNNCHVHKTLDAQHPLKVLLEKPDFKFFNYLFTDKPSSIRLFIYDKEQQKELASTAFHQLTNELHAKANNTDEEEEIGDDALSTELQTMLQGRYTIKGGGIELVNGIGAGYAPDGTPRVYTQTLMQSQGSFKNKQHKLGIEITSAEATEQRAWLDGEDASFENSEGFDRATSEVSMGDYTTTDVPIGVGAWTASNLVVDEPGATPGPQEFLKVGDVAWFSSYGIDYAGHHHPFVVAPGVNIYSAANSFYEDGKYELADVIHRQSFNYQFKEQSAPRDYYWIKASGTSMATPIVAGIIALWMQAAHDKGRKLTVDDVKDIIRKSAEVDDFTTQAGIRAGCGKINAYKGLLHVLGLADGIQELSHHQPADITFRLAGQTLHTDGAADDTPVTIYNISGAQLRKTSVQQGTVNLAGLQRGVYAIQIGRLGSTLIRL